MKRLTATLCEQPAEAARLDAAIATDLKELGHEVVTPFALHAMPSSACLRGPSHPMP